MTESDLLRAIVLELSNGDVRLFRSNAGVAWQGIVIRQNAYELVLKNPRPVRLGVPGMADLTGWAAGRYLAIEGKYSTGLRTDQRAFLNAVRDGGGLAGVARSVDDAKRIIDGELTDLK